MRCYYIEDSNSNIHEYTRTLSGAKRILQVLFQQDYPETELRIVALYQPKGYQFGEGFPKYNLIYRNGKYTRQTLKCF